jgi:phenylalanine-4-hydroxylase
MTSFISRFGRDDKFYKGLEGKYWPMAIVIKTPQEIEFAKFSISFVRW